jgi:hypothetical protein
MLLVPQFGQSALGLLVKLERKHRQKKKTNQFKTKDIKRLIGKKSHLSSENQLLIYRTVIKPIWSYGIELWGCASKSNTVIMERSKYKIRRTIANAFLYVKKIILHAQTSTSPTKLAISL